MNPGGHKSINTTFLRVVVAAAAAAAADGCGRWETVRETAGGRGLDTGYPRCHTQTGRGSGEY